MDSRSNALQKLKQQQAHRRSMLASTSHEQHAEYMQRFEEALEDMEALSTSQQTSCIPSKPTSSLRSDRVPSTTSTAKASPGRPAGSLQSHAAAAGRVGVTSRTAAAKDHVTAANNPAPGASWATGPVDAAGVLCQLSERNLLCSAANWAASEVVVGSADHALYVLDCKKGSKKRTLYSESCGHSEWVTCVTYCSNGSIVSGGMDSQLWCWPAGGSRGQKLQGHAGAISQVHQVPGSSSLMASCSYDQSVRLWSLGSARHAQAACLQGHKAPVLQMDCSSSGGCIATGDRSGALMVWDVQGGSGSSSSSSWGVARGHEGHVTALRWGSAGAASGDVLLSGGQDGVVRVWDCRQRGSVAAVRAHVGPAGKGAVGDIAVAAGGLVVTAGADLTLKVLGVHSGFKVLHSTALPDFPYCLKVLGGYALCGCGDGSCLVVDLATGQVQYGLGANKAAVRAIEADGSCLVCAGDDGGVMVYQFA